MGAHPSRYRHTKIIATLGPATESDERIARLIEAGVDLIRLNMAHGTEAWVTETVKRIRSISGQVGRQVAIMMDVKGPEIRTGALDEPIPLAVGDRLRLVTGSDPGVDGVQVNYPELPREVEIGGTILVDSGLIRLRVLDKDPSSVTCEVLTPGVLGSRRHINLPGVTVDLPALTKKDEADLRTGVAAGIDFVALSFVRQAADIRVLRGLLDELGSEARIVAKIEEQAGVRNMKEIVAEADGVMVARGDLGIEIDYHQLPLVQSSLVGECKSQGKPVIIATHLLESMIHSPVPTRAEVSDVCNAVRQQADAVMLSGETATGAYPMESVEVLENIIESIEPTVDSGINTRIELVRPKAKMLRSAAVLAQELGGSGIVVFTRSGFLARMLGGLRAARVPIYAFTDRETTFRQALLPWGVEPFLMPFSEDPEETILDALGTLKEKRWCEPGSWLVVITNVLASDQVIDTMQLRQLR